MTTESTNHTDDLHRQLRELTERTHSPAARYAHVLLLLAATGAGVLLLTEAALLVRTQVAFGVMLAIAGSWVGYTFWALCNRRPLMHAHRVVAGYLATSFSGPYAVVAMTAAAIRGSQMAALGGGLGVAMLGVAVVSLLLGASAAWGAAGAAR